MKIAIVGSRDIIVADIGKYVSDGDEIVSGGAVGVDRCASEYAKKHGMTCRVSYSAFTSLWLYADHADITLENQQQYYKIRFLPCVQPKTVLHFVGRNLYTTTQVHGASPIAAEQFSG